MIASPAVRFVSMGMLACLLTVPRSATAGDRPDFAVNRIPASLRANAPAVIRLHEIRFTAQEDGDGTLTFTRVVTVFKESAKSEGEFELWYGAFKSVEEFEGSILDANGEEIREIEDRDIGDVSTYSASDLAADIRVRFAKIYHDRLPYTIVFTYEVEFDGGLEWPTWTGRTSRYPVERSLFEVRHPAEIPLRYWVNADSLRPYVVRHRTDSVYSWEARNLPYLAEDDSWSDIEDVAPLVRIAPRRFRFGGHEGNMETWQGLGAWYGMLAEGRRTLPDAAHADVARVTSGLTETSDKVRTLYRYLQDRTRYISVQLGIGGWQPFEASYVHGRQWGDCKGLTNYMIALLDAAGIQAYPVLIRSGQYTRPMLMEFPSNQFNHVIVCVPNGADSLWLECTSQDMPFGMIGASNEERPGLLISARGGTVIRTPVSTAGENMQARTTNLDVQSDGSAFIRFSMTSKGNQQHRLRSVWSDEAPDKRPLEVLRQNGLGDCRITSMNLHGAEERSPAVTVFAEVHAPTFASKSSTRMFIPANPFERAARAPRHVARRLSPLKVAYRWADIDTIRISVPDRFEVEALPSDVEDSSAFGRYKMTVSRLSPSDVLIIRRKEYTETRIPADQYEEYRRFESTAVKGDRSQVVLRLR